MAQQVELLLAMGPEQPWERRGWCSRLLPSNWASPGHWSCLEVNSGWKLACSSAHCCQSLYLPPSVSFFFFFFVVKSSCLSNKYLKTQYSTKSNKMSPRESGLFDFLTQPCDFRSHVWPLWLPFPCSLWSVYKTLGSLLSTIPVYKYHYKMRWSMCLIVFK